MVFKSLGVGVGGGSNCYENMRLGLTTDGAAGVRRRGGGGDYERRRGEFFSGVGWHAENAGNTLKIRIASKVRSIFLVFVSLISELHDYCR